MYKIIAKFFKRILQKYHAEKLIIKQYKERVKSIHKQIKHQCN